MNIKQNCSQSSGFPRCWSALIVDSVRFSNPERGFTVTCMPVQWQCDLISWQGNILDILLSELVSNEGQEVSMNMIHII